MTTTDLIWLALGFAVLAFELNGLDKQGRTTISEYVWALRRWKLWFLPMGTITIAVFMGWLAWHFLFEG
jgi:hypothetical protein